MQDFAEQLNFVRKERQITQEQLAQEMNVSRTTISRWEKGIMTPDIDTVKQLSQILNYNFFATEAPTEEQPAPDASIPPDVPQEVPVQETDETDAQPTETFPCRNMAWPAVLGAVLLCAVVAICLLMGNRAFKNSPLSVEPFTYGWYQQEQVPVKGQAFVRIAPNADPVPLIRNAEYSDGLGWVCCFTMEETNGIPFTVEKVTCQMYASETRYDTWVYEGEEIRHSIGDPTLTSGRIVEWGSGLGYQPMKGIALAIQGTDANGNALTFYRFAELSPELPE